MKRSLVLGIAISRDRPPIEFQLAGIQPEPWTPEACLARMAGYVMTSNARREIIRARLVQALCPEKAAQVLETDPPKTLEIPAGLDLNGIDSRILAVIDSATAPISFRSGEGSNNWVVSGALTTTGKPILANDPHRAITLPSLRYLVHLVGPDWNVIGAGEPALPGVAVGHNERIGFGITIVGEESLMDIHAIRSEMPLLEHCLYFNTAGISPSPAVVTDTLIRDFTEIARHGPPMMMDIESHRAQLMEARRRMADLCGVDVTDLCLTRGVSDGVSIVFNGFDWKEGDELIITDEEHPTVQVPADYLAAARGVTLKHLPVSGDAEQILQRLRGLLTSRSALKRIPGLTIESPEATGMSTGMIAFRVDGVDGKDINAGLRARNIITRPTFLKFSGVRVSVAVFTTEEELDTVVSAVAEIVRAKR